MRKLLRRIHAWWWHITKETCQSCTWAVYDQKYKEWWCECKYSRHRGSKVLHEYPVRKCNMYIQDDSGVG
jgi:hypothetical protein